LGACLLPVTREFDLMKISVYSRRLYFLCGAGWSSPVARQAHNLKVAGSNPAPATKLKQINTAT
jgi:hypothetical protein